MVNYVLIRHKVRDFSQWKRGYDAHLPKRNEAGLTEKHLLRGASDPNEYALDKCPIVSRTRISASGFVACV